MRVRRVFFIYAPGLRVILSGGRYLPKSNPQGGCAERSRYLIRPAEEIHRRSSLARDDTERKMQFPTQQKHRTHHFGHSPCDVSDIFNCCSPANKKSERGSLQTNAPSHDSNHERVPFFKQNKQFGDTVRYLSELSQQYR